MNYIKLDKSLINQSEVSRRLNCSQAYISMILDGKRTGPKAQKKIKEIKQVMKTFHEAA